MTLRDLERESIRAFVQSAADDGYLSGRVLDYGCGKQPYRDIVEAAGGEYVGYDHESFPAHVGDVSVGTDPCYDERFDAILSTQVVQYVPLYPGERYLPRFSLQILLARWRHALGCDELGGENGYLVLTYPTNWPEVEPEDLHRFTKAGMERLLTEAGFTIIRHEERAEVVGAVRVPNGLLTTGDEFALGYGVIAQA